MIGDTQTTGQMSTRVKLLPGAILWTWCSVCMDRTDHVYQPGELVKLQCIDPDHAGRAAERKAAEK